MPPPMPTHTGRACAARMSPPSRRMSPPSRRICAHPLPMAPELPHPGRCAPATRSPPPSLARSLSVQSEQTQAYEDKYEEDFDEWDSDDGSDGEGLEEGG